MLPGRIAQASEEGSITVRTLASSDCGSGRAGEFSLTHSHTHTPHLLSSPTQEKKFRTIQEFFYLQWWRVADSMFAVAAIETATGLNERAMQ